MDSIPAFHEIVVVSQWAFLVWWLVFLGVHLVTCGYNMAYALFYWCLDNIEIRRYLVFYHVGMPPDYYGIIGGKFNMAAKTCIYTMG